MGKQKIVLQYADRICDICKSVEQESVWKVNQTLITKNHQFIFKNNIVICKRCGFCFVSPVVKQEELNKYYTDSFVRFEAQPVNFDIERRASLIIQYAPENGSYLEIGSHDAPQLYSYLRKYFNIVDTVEMAEDGQSTYKSIEEVEANKYDVVAHFHTVEHFSSPGKFLSDCSNILKKNGIMIVEVPDIRLMVKYPAHLEIPLHMSHFSIESLSRLAGNYGFKLFDIDSVSVGNASGIILLFRKTGKNILRSDDFSPVEYVVAKACVRECKEYMEKVEQRINDLATKINSYLAANKKVALWCANQMLYRLIKNIKVTDNLLIVDDDPKKENFFINPKVLPADAVSDHIIASDLIIISTHFYKEIIKKRLLSIVGSKINNIEIEILDWILENK